MVKIKNKLIVILGLTASGISELAIKLAKKLNGEIVSADSRQVYKGMDIGTAKTVSAKQTRNKNAKQTQNIIQGIPHHLIDVVYPNEEFNVAIYKKLAIKKIKDIQKRGKLPFLVGGTGLYIQAVVDNVNFPKVPSQKELRKELEEKSAPELFKIYEKLDSKGTKFIEKENKRRLIRAIEVCKATGGSFWEKRKKERPLFEVLQIGIKSKKEELKKRIEKRVKRMFLLGLEREVENLTQKYGWKIPSMQTIGYQEWFSTKNEKEEIKQEIIRHTIQFAKRQITWFKRDKRIKWIPFSTHYSYQWAKKLINKFLEK